ncbi:MAG TPA: pilus assembly protein N-terminal domain-containing protein, partial [Devosia sp.]
ILGETEGSVSVTPGVFSMRMSLAAVLGITLAIAPVFTPGTAQAADAPINVNINMARILRINAPAATVIVGNPGIADVLIQDPQTMVLTGKSFGQTNLIVLDSQGRPIADTIIEVVQMQAGALTVYQGQARTTLACAPVCQNTITMGDDMPFSSQAVASSQLMKTISEN